MERRSIAFPLPLIATPQSKETLDPLLQLRVARFWKINFQMSENLQRHQFVANGMALDLIQHVVRHQIVFVGLLLIGWTKLGSWLLIVDGF